MDKSQLSIFFLSSLLLKLLALTDSTQTLILHKGFSFTDSHHPHPQTRTDSSTSSPPPLKLTHHADPCTITDLIHHPPHPLRSPTHLCQSCRYLPQPIALGFYANLRYHSILSLFFFLFLFFFFFFFYNDFCDMRGKSLSVERLKA